MSHITQVNYNIQGLSALQNSDLAFTNIFGRSGGLGLGGGSAASSVGQNETPIINYIHTADAAQEFVFFAGQTYTVTFDRIDNDPGIRYGAFFMGYGDNGEFNLGSGSDDVQFYFEDAGLGSDTSFTFTFTPTVADLGGSNAIAGYLLLAETSGNSQGRTGTIDNLQFNMTVCFARGTLVETPSGPRAIETLSVGDRVLTRDGGPQPIKWIGVSRFSQDQMQRHVGLRSILIKQGALGENKPERDLRLSRQHRILFSDPICERMFGAKEVLIPAAKLAALPGIEIESPSDEGAEYFHIFLSEHHIITSEGLETESFLPGPMALASMSDNARSSLFACLAFADGCSALEPARMIPNNGRRVHRFIERWGNRLRRHQPH